MHNYNNKTTSQNLGSTAFPGVERRGERTLRKITGTTEAPQPYDQLKKLRTALAISQGTKLLSTLQQEAEATVSHDQTKRVTYLTGLFSRIHREMFHDWKEQATVSHRPGVMMDADKRRQFRKTIERLVLDDDGNTDTAIFDNNGFVIKTDNIAARLALFYQDMRHVRPFGYGNRITLDFFMTALGALPAFKAVYEQGIDFRRLEADDAAALHDLGSSLEDITLAFEHAFDPGRSKSLQNIANSYGKWPENKKFVFGIPFLSHKSADGIDCLVTVNGGLIPLENIKEDPFIAGMHFADYPPSAPENIIGYLPGTEFLHDPGKTEIDGIAIEANGTAPLFCLDINMLTGLRSPSHTELLELLSQCEGNDDKNILMKLAGNEYLKNKLLIAANGDTRLKRSVEIAYDRLGKIKAKLDTAIDDLFEGKTPDAHPKIFMCMGGAGSGKTAVEEIARAHCGDNFVIASLDEFRKISDLYQVLTAANHHSDDYVYVEPFANRLRDMVADKARDKGINILYDGTGIPYHPRYSKIIKQFKSSGFQTQITAVDAFIIKPQGREDELIRSGAIGSVKTRFEKTGRALPWVITVYKHVRAPRSFLMALEDPCLEKISLFANDGERDRHYLVAESFDLSDQEVRALKRHQLAGTLAGYLKSFIETQLGSVLKKLAHEDRAKLEALIDRNTGFEENNVAYQIYPSKDGNRVLLIYNTRRMVDFMEKRQLNPNASGEEGLLHKPDSLAFHVDPLTKEPWTTRLQGSFFV
ncbi:MAG: zeta toxin family protein [Gammaproteobacteria bacterium]